MGGDPPSEGKPFQAPWGWVRGQVGRSSTGKGELERRGHFPEWTLH